MPDKFKLVVKVDDTWIKKFNAQGYKLCLASSVSNDQSPGAKDAFNVVALAKEVAATVTFSWYEDYYIAASTDGFSNGVCVDSTTDIVPISFGQSYTLSPLWENAQAMTDPSAPEGGFLFINNAKEASAILYKDINGVQSPIYISAAGPLPPGIEKMIPKIKVKVWFAVSVETGSMISDFATFPMTINYTGKTEQTVMYDANGVWNPVKSNFSVDRLRKELELLEAAQRAAGHRSPHKALTA